jgi:hypothetical protein
MMCEAGYFCKAGEKVQCAVGTYCPEAGLSAGEPCRQDETLYCPVAGATARVVCPEDANCGDGAVARVCEIGKVGTGGICSSCADESTMYVLENKCEDCPIAGVLCERGSLTPKVDFWMPNVGYATTNSAVPGRKITRATPFYKCLNKDVCRINATAVDSHGYLAAPYTFYSYCKQGHEGILCDTCVAGYFKSKRGCFPCESPRYGEIVGLIMGGLIAASMIKLAMHKYQRYLIHASTLSHLKVVLSFITVTLTLDHQFGE